MALGHDPSCASYAFSEDDLGPAADLWGAALARLESDAANPLARGKARAIREALTCRPGMYHSDIFVNDAIYAVAQYLGQVRGAAIRAKEIDSIRKDSASILDGITRLEQSIADLAAALSLSDRSEAGEDAWGDFTLGAACARGARQSIATMLVHVDRAAARSPRTTAGIDAGMRVQPEETLARQLGRLWAARGLSLGGGSSGGGVDDVLAHVIETTDPKRPAKKTRKKWLDQKLMVIARDAGQAFINS